MSLNNSLKLLNKTIIEQIEIAKQIYQKVRMIGDFNAKIRNHFPGNKRAISKR